MRNDFSKFTKVFTSITCFSLILISNNSELAARYLLDLDGEYKKIKFNNKNVNQQPNDPITGFDFEKSFRIIFKKSIYE